MKSNIKKTYLAISSLMVADLILYLSKGISFAGVIIDKLLFWSWLLLTIFIIATEFHKKWIKIYSAVLFIFLLLSLIPMGVPFIMIAGYAVHFEKSTSVDDLRLAYTSKSPLDSPHVYVLKEYVLFEKEIGKIDLDYGVNGKYYSFSDVKKIEKVKDENNDILLLRFAFNDGAISEFKVE